MSIYCRLTGEFVENYDQYLTTKYWDIIRRYVAEEQEHICQDCGRLCEGIQGRVHHLNYKFLGSEKFENLVYLCHNCHLKRHKTPIPDLYRGRLAEKSPIKLTHAAIRYYDFTCPLCRNRFDDVVCVSFNKDERNRIVLVVCEECFEKFSEEIKFYEFRRTKYS